MAGSVQKRGDNSYYLVYHMGYDANGKRLRKTKTVQAKNKTEAKKKLAAFITEIELGEYIAPSNKKFYAFVEVWKKHAMKKLSPKTIEMYTYLLDARMLPAFSHLNIEDISHVFIDDYVAKLESDGLSSSTIQKHHNLFNHIFNLAKTYELIKHNPMDKVDKVTVKYKPGQVYNSDELKTLYRLLNKEENTQMVLMIKMALLTGMRKGELLGLQWQDVDFSTNTINIRHSLSYTIENGYILKDPKTKGSKRKVAPPKKLMEELKKHISIKRTDRVAASELWEGGKYYFVFSSDLGKPVHSNSPNRWWNRFIDRVNREVKKNEKPILKRVRFHDLRHTAATDLINRGANPHSISKRLGHSSIKTTMNIYGHYLEEADQKIANMLDEDYI